MDERPWFKFYDEGVPRSIPYPDIRVADLLRKAAANFPNVVATNFMGHKLTYAALLAQTNRFATALANLGIKPGDRVAVDLPNCPQSVISWYAIQTLGAIAVMTNPLYVERELEQAWCDAGVETVVLFDRLWPRIQKVRGRTPLQRVIVTGIQDYLPFPLNLLYPFKARRENMWADVPRGKDAPFFFKDLVANYPATPPPVTIKGDDIAALQFTGGTTGTPKAAMITHRNIVAVVNQIRQAVLYKSKEGEERMMAVAPFFHVFGLNAVLNGGVNLVCTLLIQPRYDAKMVIDAIEKEKASFMVGPPTMFIGIMNHPRAAKADLSSLRVCVSGAAPMPVAVMEEFERRTGARITEGYGLTEGTVAESCNPLYGTRKPGSIGIPFPDNEMKIVDIETGTKELPAHQVGELLLKGPTVMKGYWNKPKETAEAIRDGWLYTGDIAKMDEDGFVFIVDRKKDMIIVGGYNVYPRDVEEVLYEHPKVLDACVIGVLDPYRGEAVKAFLVLKPGETATPEEMIEFCKERLAGYKVPRLIEFRDALPRTLIGKVLRRSLKEEEIAKGST